MASELIDGEVGDDEWAGAAIIDGNFIQIEPEFGQPSPFRTVVRIGQTEGSLYVAFTSYDPDSSRVAAAVTQRDGNLESDDSVALVGIARNMVDQVIDAAAQWSEGGAE